MNGLDPSVAGPLAALLRAGTAFLDVRSPLEAARGTVPGAVNVPLLEDDERRRVGITYKQQGHDAAVAVGHRIVSGDVRQAREDAWERFVRLHPDCWIYCWRGGQRSEIVQSWLRARGLDRPRVAGGFKALRHVCLDLLAGAPAHKHWLVLGGRTGSGKTDLLVTLPNAIDLEGIAAHRGSAFGARDAPQPTPVTFENTLAVAFLQHAGDTLVVEDESRTIGRLALPEGWHARMQQAPLAVLQTPLEQRVANIVREYVTEPLANGTSAASLYERYAQALGRIERRLGGARRRDVQACLDQGFEHGAHDGWVERLLVWYYDPMYDHQLAGKRARVVVEGCAEDVGAFLAAQ